MMAENPMWLTVFGPGLPAVDAERGEYHVHGADCDECRRYDPAKAYTGWFVDEASVVETISPGRLVEAGDYQAALAAFWFAPCCRDLPEASALASALEDAGRARAGGPPPALYYLTCDQTQAIAELGNDVAVRGFDGQAEGSVEVLLFLPSEETWDHESLVIDAAGSVVSRTKIEER